MRSISKELVNLLEKCDAEYTRLRLEPMKKIVGNPLEIDILSTGVIQAFKIVQWPHYWYGNKVLITESTENITEEEFDKINNFFLNSAIQYRIEITPLHLTTVLSKKIQSLNFMCSGFNTVLFKTIEGPLEPKIGRDISIRKFTEKDNLDNFLDVYQDGFSYKRFTGDEKELIKAWCSTTSPGLSLYGAYMKESLISVAILFIWKKVAVMADATTLPEYRNKGIQKKFIERRLQDAYDQGCMYATSYVGFGSTSHNNFLKLGFETCYTKVEFRKNQNSLNE